MIELTEKLYQEVLVGFNRNWGAGKYDVCTFGGIYERDKVVQVDRHNCHYALRHMDSGVEMLFSSMKPHDLLKDTNYYREFVDIFVNKSIFSRLLVEKDVDKIIEDRIFFVDASYNRTFVAAGLIFSRYVFEWPAKARHLVELVRAGVNVDLAIFMSHCMVETGNTLSIGGTSTAHSVYSHQLSDSALSKILKGFVPRGKSFKQCSGYDGIFEFWGEHTKNYAIRKIEKLLKGQEVGNEYIHPFPKYTPQQLDNFGDDNRAGFKKYYKGEFFTLVKEAEERILKEFCK